MFPAIISGRYKRDHNNAVDDFEGYLTCKLDGFEQNIIHRYEKNKNKWKF